MVTESGGDGAAETAAPDADPDFEALLAFLKENRGFDFTGYKRSSLMRRVARRMQVLAIDGWSEYHDYLQVHPDEFTILFNTVLINVTAFFRDAESWQRLRTEVLPGLVAAKKPGETIRVWCAGCATGEEAYSIAMLLAGLLGPDQFREQVKIYATDVDEEALAVARQASYSEADVESVPADLLEHCFVREGQRYVFVKDLRRVVIFGRNDLVQDAPISRVDLLTCRNTLMYLNAETQARVLSRFNFALNDGGVLFLGKAEMLLSHSQLFSPVDLKHRFFGKVQQYPPGLGLPAVDRDLQPIKAEPEGRERLRTEALLSAPVAAIVVTDNGTMAGVNQRAETLFGVSGRDIGRAFLDVDVSYRPIELRPRLEEAKRERRTVRIRDVEWMRSPGEKVVLDIQIAPLIVDDGAGSVVGGAAVFFADVTEQRKLQDELQYANRQIETTYEELQSTVEELETTNEELQSTVEELETTNEELQSTNEELETMNEELQSTNDELQSINDELQDRTDQLNEANAFLESILRSLRSGVIVVDTELVVRVWNRRAEDLWGLRPEEAVGQHLLNLDVGISTDRLRPLVREVTSGTGSTTEGAASPEVSLDAINRRGRPVRIRVAVNPLEYQPGKRAGAIIVMDQLNGGE